jgi:hypothetical protein
MIFRITYTVLCYPNWLIDGLWNDCRVSKHVAVAYIYIQPYCLVLWWKLNISRFLHSFILTFFYTGDTELLGKVVDGAHASYLGRLEFEYWSGDRMTEIFRRFPQPLEAHMGIVSQIIPFRDYRFMLYKRQQQRLLLLLRFLLLLPLVLFLLLRWHYSSMRPFASVLAISQSALLFDLSFKSVILRLLISVCTQFRHLFLIVLLRPIHT